MILFRGSLTAPLACALFQQETTVRAQILGIVARTRFFWKSVSFCFNFSFCFCKFVRQNGKDKCQEHIVGDLTRPRPRPGEFVSMYSPNSL
jgi:hypothetical protein